MIDKPFYDYDFEALKTAKKRLLYEDTVRSEDETRNILSMFGLSTKADESMEELQALAMNEMTETNT